MKINYTCTVHSGIQSTPALNKKMYQTDDYTRHKFTALQSAKTGKNTNDF